MKLKVVAEISQEEYEAIESNIHFDPCERIRCGGIECSQCPLRDIARSLRKAQDDFLNTLAIISEKEITQ